MKKILLICMAVIVCVSATAQNPKIARIGAGAGSTGASATTVTDSANEISLPGTTLYVDVVVEKQEVIVGPYSRYAQKYLGISAPLTDKLLHQIKVSKISRTKHLSKQYHKSQHQEDSPIVASHTNPEHGFPKLLVDKTSGAAQNLEESARLAANKIFEIRDSRYELITGEAGENVFGAGLASAIAELNRLEEEYISLFLGKQTLTTTTLHFEVIPSEGTLNYIVCRYTEADGLLPKDDLSGMPILLDLKPLTTNAANLPMTELGATTKPSSKSAAYRVSADVECRIIFEGKELASTVIPIFQFGQTIYIAQ